MWLPKSTVKFDPNVAGHLPSYGSRPKMIPDGYSYSSLKAGYEATTKLRKSPNLVDMSKGAERSNEMFLKLDPEYIKEVKKENRKRNFNLNDYLPNSLKRDRSSSRISNSDVGTGLLGRDKSRTSINILSTR